MAVDDPNVIDFIAKDRSTGETVLTIADHLEWDPRNGHLLILQRKLNRYFAFIESGEILEHCPTARRIRIDVACRHEPSPDGVRFLETVCEIAEREGWEFTWRYWPDVLS